MSSHILCRLSCIVLWNCDNIGWVTKIYYVYSIHAHNYENCAYKVGRHTYQRVYTKEYVGRVQYNNHQLQELAKQTQYYGNSRYYIM